MNHSVSQAEGIPDAILVQRILGGEATLYEYIIRKYNKRLYSIDFMRSSCSEELNSSNDGIILFYS